ncbi:DinB family protein [Neobacillus notoginsengisoli]|uniref:DinB family protein n=1 Tax=Neobacillus notoginsengisoli TaxID=1578198 RepID=A0A417YYK6_9BACI|nr:DinB family protein [Neobacillus notoginsengisoli]RHW42848.1 DinB family protein [Neobacillus notoginsengisoli]
MSDLKLINSYKDELQKYSLEHLRYISEEGVWSIGQMYDHLIVVAHEYLENMETCATLNEVQPFGKTEFGERLFKNGGFPPIKIRLPDELNAPPNNSDSREKLINRMDLVILRLGQWESEVDNINPNYKVEHGGFGWLNAREWYDLVGMHFRHHVRQKDELEQRLVK